MPTMPALVPVSSSNLLAVSYDPATETLYVAFKAKPPALPALYAYEGVPTAIHAALMAAPSHGTYLNTVIKADRTRYPYHKLEDGAFTLIDDREAA